MHTRIRELRKRLGLTQIEFGAKVGVTLDGVYAWEKGRSRVKESALRLIETIFNVNPEWLRNGKGMMFNAGGEDALSRRDDSYFAYVPRYNVEASAGGGGVVEQESFIDTLAFQKKWVDALPYPANTLSIISVTGDSMEPTYKNRDIIMLTTDINVLYPGVYVIRDYLGLRVKRLNKDKDNNLHVISDNKIYPEEVYTQGDLAGGSIEIIGKVIWFGRTV